MAVNYPRKEDATSAAPRFNRWCGAARLLYPDVAQNAEVTKLRALSSAASDQTTF
jgi:hypothetical protein